MHSPFQPLIELLNGDAYSSHPADATLPLSQRFAGRVLILCGGSIAGPAWTQRVAFPRLGAGITVSKKSPLFRRGTVEWSAHLAQEAKHSSGWVVLLVEQQWQATLSTVSSASLGAPGVERMLRVRDAAAEFGDERLPEDVIRVAIDHPTMEGSIVAGVRIGVVQQLEKEATAQGFKVAAVRIPVLSLLEQHLARLAEERRSPAQPLVAYDGQSALIVGVRDGAFDPADGGISFVVNRTPAEVRAQILRRLVASPAPKDSSNGAVIIGEEIAFDSNQPASLSELKVESRNALEACLDDSVRHDFRTEMEEVRPALPSWSRAAIFGTCVLILGSLGGAAVELAEGWRMDTLRGSEDARRIVDEEATARAKSRIAAITAEEVRARRMGDWVDRNYHAQALLNSFLLKVPTEVSVDAVSILASEGLPQARFKFTLLGAEPAQRQALRSIESGLFALGYEIARREDPLPSSSRRGGVVYAWDLILPNFGK